METDASGDYHFKTKLCYKKFSPIGISEIFIGTDEVVAFVLLQDCHSVGIVLLKFERFLFLLIFQELHSTFQK